MSTRVGMFQSKKSISTTINIPSIPSGSQPYHHNLNYTVSANRYAIVFAKNDFLGSIGKQNGYSRSYGYYYGRSPFETSAFSINGPHGIAVLKAGESLWFLGTQSVSAQSLSVTYDIIEFALHSDI